MTKKRFRKGKSILTDFPTGAIIDEKTGERYYDGIKPSYISSNELVKILNKLNDENEQLKEENQELIRKKNNLKDLLINSESVLEQKELQKIIYKMVYATIDDKINELEKKYEFGKTEVQKCPMFNIRFGIHILEELKKEFSYD